MDQRDHMAHNTFAPSATSSTSSAPSTVIERTPSQERTVSQPIDLSLSPPRTSVKKRPPPLNIIITPEMLNDFLQVARSASEQQMDKNQMDDEPIAKQSCIEVPQIAAQPIAAQPIAAQPIAAQPIAAQPIREVLNVGRTASSGHITSPTAQLENAASEWRRAKRRYESDPSQENMRLQLIASNAFYSMLPVLGICPDGQRHVIIDYRNVTLAGVHSAKYSDKAKDEHNKYIPMGIDFFQLLKKIDVKADNILLVGSKIDPFTNNIAAHLGIRIHNELTEGGEIGVDARIKAAISTLIHRTTRAGEKPGVLYLFSGDGNDEDPASSMPEAIEAALMNGWSVEICCDPRGRSRRYNNLHTRYHGSLKLTDLNTMGIIVPRGELCKIAREHKVVVPDFRNFAEESKLLKAQQAQVQQAPAQQKPKKQKKQPQITPPIPSQFPMVMGPQMGFYGMMHPQFNPWCVNPWAMGPFPNPFDYFQEQPQQYDVTNTYGTINSDPRRDYRDEPRRDYRDEPRRDDLKPDDLRHVISRRQDGL